MEMEKKILLYVDDERVNLELFRLNFSKEYDVRIALSANEGLSILREHNIDVIISDLRMPEMNGFEFIKEIKKDNPGKICIILSAYLEEEDIKNSISEGLIFSYLTKPWKKPEVKRVIEDAIAQIHKAS
jgi:CheY-like chemotaxis protein